MDAKEKKREYDRLYRTKNKDRIKKAKAKYYQDNKDECDRKSKLWSEDNREKSREIKLRYNKSNPDVMAKAKTKRRNAERKCVPEWSETHKIKTVYKKARWLGTLTGKKYHVDHIIPIQGDNVCGLHVWSNLQILEDSINCSKGNRHD